MSNTACARRETRAATALGVAATSDDRPLLACSRFGETQPRSKSWFGRQGPGSSPSPVGCSGTRKTRATPSRRRSSAFKALAGFDGHCQLVTWLHRIAVNAALMKLRRARRRPESPIEELLPDFDETGHHLCSIEPWRPEPLAELERKRSELCEGRDRSASLDSYRDCPPPARHRGDEHGGLPGLDLSANAVKVRLHRARQALRTVLDPTFQ